MSDAMPIDQSPSDLCSRCNRSAEQDNAENVRLTRELEQARQDRVLLQRSHDCYASNVEMKISHMTRELEQAQTERYVALAACVEMAEAGERLKTWCLQHSMEIRDIPDAIWKPFSASLKHNPGQPPLDRLAAAKQETDR